jgi:DNA-binding transcriptional ArsR family regulator
VDALELLAHPVRLRIVHAMRGGRILTTAELSERLPDVSKAMLYRHVDLLASAGILEVARERRVRGAVERLYRLRPERAAITTEAATALSAEDYWPVFATALAVLTAEFRAYLDREDADPARDLVGFRQHAIWVSHEELEQLIAGLRQAIAPLLANEHTPERAQYLLSPILFPLEQPSVAPASE